MSITSGFYDSLNGDRRYTAKEMSAMFDGIINDGVLANIGDAFAVKAGTDNTVTVGTGRAWFNSTWVFNDALLPLTVPDSTLDQTSDQRVIDVVVLEVDRSEAIRAASVKMVGPKVYGSAYTVEQALENAINELTTTFNATSPDVQRYPLAAICRNGGNSDAIAQSNIYNYIGTSRCPFVTGILQVQSIDNIVAQWESEFDTWLASTSERAEGDIADWESRFETWFASVSGTLEGDAATSLAMKVANLENGTTPAGDASKLNGREASEYLTKDSQLDASNMQYGTFGGPMMANKYADPPARLIRNISSVTGFDLEAGVTRLETGEIVVVYE